MDNNIFFHVLEPDLVPKGTVFENIDNIDNYEENSIDNIITQDLFDYLVDDDCITILNKIKKILMPGGLVHLQGTDIKQLSIAVTFDQISTEHVKDILYPYKKNINTMAHIIQMVEACGFSVNLKKFMNVFEYYLVLEK